MSKVILQLEKYNKVSVEFSSDDIAQDTFLALTTMMLNEPQPDSTDVLANIINTTTEEVKPRKKVIHRDIQAPKVNIQVDLEKVVSELKESNKVTADMLDPKTFTCKFKEESKTIKPKEVEDKVFDPSKKLTFFKCTTCGMIQYRYTHDLDVVECYHCSTEIQVYHTDGEYKCPDCDYLAHFKVGNSILSTMKCKGCGTILPMTYDDKEDKYVNIVVKEGDNE